jgi:hypothetical protein
MEKSENELDSTHVKFDNHNLFFMASRAHLKCGRCEYCENKSRGCLSIYASSKVHKSGHSVNRHASGSTLSIMVFKHIKQ